MYIIVLGVECISVNLVSKSSYLFDLSFIATHFSFENTGKT